MTSRISRNWRVLSLFLFLGMAMGAGVSVSTTAAPADHENASKPVFDAAIYELRLHLSPEATSTLRRTPRKYVHASLRADGVVYGDVGLQLKGSAGSFRPFDDKPALTVDLDRFAPGTKFCGVTKLHLDNAVEDPSYLCALIGSEVFRAVGVPTPEVTHALVWLNGRRLGLYVLREGLSEEFRQRSFGRGEGVLLEPERGQDVDGRMQVKNGAVTKANASWLQPLAAAAREPDRALRWPRLEAVLDLDRFLTFMAVEVFLAHRDGYTLAKNNYRIHYDTIRHQAVFLPYGMDQLFGPRDLPWKPQMAGLVARAVMDLPVGQQRFEERIAALSAKLPSVAMLTNRVNQAVALLRRHVTSAGAANLDQEAARLCQRIQRRTSSWERQLSQSRSGEYFPNSARLPAWRSVDAPEGGQLIEGVDARGTAVLRIVAGPVTAASWRSTVRLSPGRYRFEGRAGTVAVKPLPFGQNQGAALRVSGNRPRSAGLLGDSPGQRVVLEFEVKGSDEEVQLICELRASFGEAWFDTGSLRLVKLD